MGRCREKPCIFFRILDQISQTHFMAVLWLGTCRDLQLLRQIRCITVNSKVNKTTVQALRSNTIQFNK
jgi:hypothetical protein